MKVLQRDSLTLGGFQGIKEHRLVTGSKAFGARRDSQTWDGLGNFVYLADARFVPFGETKMHGHKEVDVVSVMVEGRVAHEGSLEHGEELLAGNAQVQRAGGEGFSHNEVNPDDVQNRMIQLWVLPERAGDRAGYKLYRPEGNGLTRIYGGSVNQNDTFDGKTIIELGRFSKEETISLEGDYLVYITGGKLFASDDSSSNEVKDGDLVRATNLNMTALEESQVIIISVLN